MVITISGASFKIVVMTCTTPASRIPLVLIQVKNQIADKPVPMERKGLLPNAGMNAVR